MRDGGGGAMEGEGEGVKGLSIALRHGARRAGGVRDE